MHKFTPRTVWIQGASKGIGAAFVKHFLANEPMSKVIATSRHPLASTSELPHLLEQYGSDRLNVLPCDIRSEESISSATKQVMSRGFSSVDLLVNSSGILNLEQKGETSLKQVHQESLEATFQTNAIGPLLLVKHLEPLLTSTYLMKRKSKEVMTAEEYCSSVINISARVGSIEDNKTGGWYAYRSSKAALNMITKTIGIELYRKKVLCLALHPGTVDTDFSRAYHKNVRHEILPPDKVVEHFLNILDSSTLKNTGSYKDYKGEVISW